MASESRFDMRRGVNTAATQEIISENEVRRAKNMVLDKRGGLFTRMGSKRIHSQPLTPTGAILSLVRWFDPVAAEWTVAAYVGGSTGIRRKRDSQAEFTAWNPMSGDIMWPTGPFVRFARWRIGATTSLVATGVNLLYTLADGTFRAVANAPACAFLRPYKSRMYVAGDGAAPKRMYGSKVNDLEVWSTGSGGVQADAEQYDHEPITGIAAIGGSLLIYKEDAIQRWTGSTSAEFVLDRDSEGVARKVGLIAPDTLVEIERIAVGLSDLGPYAASVGDLQAIGEQLEDQWKAANKQWWKLSAAGWNDASKEYRLWIPGAGQLSNFVGWYWNAALNAWTGPHEMRRKTGNLVTPLAPQSFAEYELPTGESLTMFGAGDGFVRVMDTVPLDDVLADGTGGIPIEWEVEWPTLHFGSLRYEKALDGLTVAMVLPPGQQATAFWRADGEEEETATIDGESNEPLNYDFGRLPTVGRRITFGLRGTATQRVGVLGFELDAELLRRS